MSSVLNMLGLHDGGFNFVFVIPVAAVLVAVNFLFKLRLRKTQTPNQSQTTKKQKSTSNKTKDVKPSCEKKVKVKQEKRTSPSKDKEVEMSNGVIKSKPTINQTPANGKLPKKNVPVKQPGVVSNTLLNASKNNKRSENILESLDSKTEEGEWQTVAKKKQKQIKDGESIEVSTPNKSVKKQEKSPEKALKNTNKNKLNPANSIPATVVNAEEKSVEIREIIQPKSLPQDHKTVDVLFTTHTSLPSTSENSDSIEDNILITQSVPAANVAFDELGDESWADSKPQRKNRKKALRE